MLYTIYQVTHKESGKYYIGKHQTLDPNDGYMGSGQLIRRAIKKHGVEAFQKEVLHIFETEAEMNAKEAELVTDELCLREDTYNLCPGGHGGWGYVNASGLALGNDKQQARRRGGLTSKRSSEQMAKIGSMQPKYHRVRAARNGGLVAMKGKKHSVDTISKMREKQSGSGNSQFGTIWITNGTECRKIDAMSPIPNDWHRGRK